MEYCISRLKPSTYRPPRKKYLTLTESDTLKDNLDTALGVGAEHERVSSAFQMQIIRRTFDWEFL